MWIEDQELHDTMLAYHKSGIMTDEFGAMLMQMPKIAVQHDDWKASSISKEELVGNAVIYLLENPVPKPKIINPRATFNWFYNLCIASFTRTAAHHKRIYGAEDDWLEDNGYEPSHQRQMQNEANKGAPMKLPPQYRTKNHRREKFCPNCRQWRCARTGYLNSARKDGKETTCRICRNEMARASRARQKARLDT